MGTFTGEQVKQFEEALNEYIKKYGNLYPEEVLQYIKEHFLGIEFSMGIAVDVMIQVYEEIGVNEAMDKNLYKLSLDYIKKYYDINRRILDVGCGFYPSFSKKIASFQTFGSVKAIDYNVITTDVPGIIVDKSIFDQNYDVSDIDFIVGLEPCEAAIDMITVANKNDLDLCLFMCGCTHFQTRFNYERSIAYQMYLDYVINTMEMTLPKNRNYVIEYPEFFPYPVFKTYRKNSKKINKHNLS